MTRHAILVAGTLGSSPERVEDDAERVLDILEDFAIGPVVGCDLEKSVIDVRFSVEGESASDVHRQISDITATIDNSVEGRVRTATTSPEQLEAACV